MININKHKIIAAKFSASNITDGKCHLTYSNRHTEEPM
ncbi:hypothetical protein BTN50_1091 [Candidatus Enterovibrio altilux]|uniref:Uncharacterized protein n=1 Tax=Candidatus Enterovibrio altilux TaxID=1927128 RepID=A0A291B9A6_9GAMM|nr:hypothetical protein BTN50_1091 [Candidatus Enterovibrio luxaltus]